MWTRKVRRLQARACRPLLYFKFVQASAVSEAVQQHGALHYLGEVIYAQGITRAFQDGFLVLAIAYLIALIPAWILSQTRGR